MRRRQGGRLRGVTHCKPVAERAPKQALSYSKRALLPQKTRIRVGEDKGEVPLGIGQ